MKAFLQNVHLDPLSGDGIIDAGAEEELFRDVGRQAAAEVLLRRWEGGGSGEVGRCRHCGMELQDLAHVCAFLTGCHRETRINTGFGTVF